MFNTMFLFGMPGGGEWILIFLVFVLFFGANKIPELAKGLGKAMREFKDAKDGIRREIESEPETFERRKNAGEIKE